jgi:drug/metabolite transporter (DMT)-like permease
MLGATTVLGADFLRHPVFGWGDLLALSSGVFYAGYYIATQRGRQHLDTLSYIWIAGLCSTLVLLTMCLVLNLPLTGYPPRTYLFFLGAALLPQITGYLAVGYALGHLPASVVSPTMICQPVLTALLAIPLLGEMLQASQWLGGMAVLAGIFLVHRSRD